MYIVILCLLFLTTELNSQIIISEVCSFNAQSYYDEDMKSPDWIEIYNKGTKPINLKGYRIYNANDFDNAWKFPDTILAPKSYLILLASGENRIRCENYTIESSGKGIAPFNREIGMSFLYLPVSGDFDASIDVRAMNIFGRETRIALMYIEKLEEASRYVSVVALHPENCEQTLLFKDDEDEYPEKRFFYNRKIQYPTGRLRLQRNGDSIISYVWDKNAFWYNIDNSCEYPLKSDSGYLGIAFASGDSSLIAKVVVRNFILNGELINFEDLSFFEVNCDISGKHYYSKEFHTNFNLNKNGEILYLWDPAGALLQVIEIPPLRNDITYGIIAEDNNEYKFFEIPTPGKANEQLAYKGIVTSPEFSIAPGFYDNEVKVSMTIADPFATIYYTLDGSLPTKNSIKYMGEIINIDSTTIIRAIATRDNFIDSEVLNGTYFIDDSTSLAIISFITDEKNLYDEENGLFVEKNYFTDIEIPCYFEFWDENKQLRCKSNAGAKLHGQRSKKFEQKSVRVYAKTRYNATEFDYPFFGAYGNPYYERLIFRNGGTDWEKTIFRDGWAAWLSHQIPSLDAMEFRPAEMFINGKYYGIQNVRERIDEKYLSVKYKIPEDSINLLEDWEELLHGTVRTFQAFKDSLLSMELNTSEVYEFLERNVDLQNLMDYVIFELYLANIDWPWKNLKFWQSKDYDGKWRWILNDLDYICGVGSFPDFNMFTLLSDSSYKFNQWFPKLFENERFKNEFINRYADLNNTVFLPENTIQLVDSVAKIFAPEIPRHKSKYGSSYEEWAGLVEEMKEFLSRRHTKFIQHCKEYFGLTDSITVNLNVIGKGKIKINSIIPEGYPWSGTYFTEIPISLKAIPNKGYRFEQWLPDTLKGDSISITLTDVLNLTALFVESNDIDTNVIINEIMYKNHPNFESGDWFELYNNGNVDIDLNNWIFKDDNNEHKFVFPENTILKQGEYIVVAQDLSNFKLYYPEIQNVVGSFNFGLGVEDQIKIYSPDGILRDSVSYTNEAPWYSYTDGLGYSLELKNVGLDNLLPRNWQQSYVLYGTPGKINSNMVDIKDLNNLQDCKIFPAPANEFAVIEIKSDISRSYNLKLYNNLGEQIKDIGRIEINGSGFIFINLSNISQGCYYVVITAEGKQSTILKFNVIKY